MDGPSMGDDLAVVPLLSGLERDNTSEYPTDALEEETISSPP